MKAKLISAAKAVWAAEVHDPEARKAVRVVGLIALAALLRAFGVDTSALTGLL